MSPGLSRRDVLLTIAGVAASRTFAFARVDDAAVALKSLEARAGGRLGVCILNTQSGSHVGHRMDERFAMCSTFKLPLAAAILREADAARVALAEMIAFSRKDLVPYAPVVEKHLGEGKMSVAALAEAAQVTSDNVAANLLLKRLGGPGAFTAILRASGDGTTRLDRYEPELNLVLPGEEHDTTTPRAMAATMSRFLTGSLLKPASRDMLVSWMVKTRTGDKRIRAGLPKDWRAGDKTGTALADTMTDKINDIAAAWPPGKAAMIVTAYYDTNTRSAAISDKHQAVLAEVGRIAAGSI